MAHPGQGEEVEVLAEDPEDANLLYREMQRVDDECFVLFTVRKKGTSSTGMDLQVSALKYPSEDFFTMEHRASTWPSDREAEREMARALLGRVSFTETGELLVE